jgi:predicted N-acyltransferase
VDQLPEQRQCRFHKAMTEIPARAWNRLVAGQSPFLRYEFLSALERSGSVCPATGWQACHLGIYDSPQDGTPSTLLAAMPLYIKSHSYGEYVFDWSWADAYSRRGIPYYPKLVSAIPFTPSTGARLLCAPGQNEAQLRHLMMEAVLEEAKRLDLSSWHVLFPCSQESALLEARGLHTRIGTQFHWFNRDYDTFEHFLGAFNSRKRKSVRKERLAVAGEGIGFRIYEGVDITEALWREFYGFYSNTYEVRGRKPYLSLEFFLQVGAQMPANVLLVMACRGSKNMAAALSFKDQIKLYGRYWGCLQESQFLHFETCYYQGIQYAISNKLQSFDSGAQGEHKIQRGFEPIVTQSNHWIANTDFDAAIADFLTKESVYIRSYREEAMTYLPFKATG